jgi:hypothetical protein
MTGQTAANTSSTLMRRVRHQIGAIPVLGAALKSVYGSLAKPDEFRSSQSYWDTRYRQGGNSGVGSYGRLARFKAEVINRFVAGHGISSLAEFGCGDGAQLELAEYPRYVGFDVSPHIVSLCRDRFARDPSKQFYDLKIGRADTISAELAMSLDVIYHLVEDATYDTYMRRLARAGQRFLCVYSSNVEQQGHVAHIRHRCFTDWLERNAPEWTLTETVRNAFPHDPENPEETSWADFYFFSRTPSDEAA